MINQGLLQLERFNSYGLEDLQAANLMNRVDRKFLLAASELPELITKLKSICNILEIEGKRCFKYENTYYDTESLECYSQHHRGKLNRFKLRTRRYADQNKLFLERKFKSNKGRTDKQRQSLIDVSEELVTSMVNENWQSPAGKFIAVQNCDYRRLNFIRENSAERLTVDFDITYVDRTTNKKLSLNDLVVVELKQDKYSNNSEFAKVIKSMGLRQSKFSKYCIGQALLRGRDLKSNKFKPVLTGLQQITGGTYLA